MNDYFQGYPIASEDAYDITTYAGAIRTAVTCIREHSADSQIILCTPTYSGYVLTEQDSPSGVCLHEYADAVLELAEELDVDVVDNFYTLGIDSTNYTEYLTDLTHSNEEGRFLIAEKIINAILAFPD